MDSLKVSATSFGTFGVWYLDFIPFILQIIIAIMTIIYLGYKIKLIRKDSK